MAKKLYRITDLQIGSETDRKLRIDTPNDVVEVEAASEAYSTFQVWLLPEQVKVLAAAGDTDYELIQG